MPFHPKTAKIACQGKAEGSQNLVTQTVTRDAGENRIDLTFASARHQKKANNSCSFLEKLFIITTFCFLPPPQPNGLIFNCRRRDYTIHSVPVGNTITIDTNFNLATMTNTATANVFDLSELQLDALSTNPVNGSVHSWFVASSFNNVSLPLH